MWPQWFTPSWSKCSVFSSTSNLIRALVQKSIMGVVQAWRWHVQSPQPSWIKSSSEGGPVVLLKNHKNGFVKMIWRLTCWSWQPFRDIQIICFSRFIITVHLFLPAWWKEEIKTCWIWVSLGTIIPLTPTRLSVSGSLLCRAFKFVSRIFWFKFGTTFLLKRHKVSTSPVSSDRKPLKQVKFRVKTRSMKTNNNLNQEFIKCVPAGWIRCGGGCRGQVRTEWRWVWCGRRRTTK